MGIFLHFFRQYPYGTMNNGMRHSLVGLPPPKEELVATPVFLGTRFMTHHRARSYTHTTGRYMGPQDNCGQDANGGQAGGRRRHRTTLAALQRWTHRGREDRASHVWTYALALRPTSPRASVRQLPSTRRTTPTLNNAFARTPHVFCRCATLRAYTIPNCPHLSPWTNGRWAARRPGVYLPF